MVDGIPVRQLARDYGIAEAAIRQRKNAQVDSIKSVANQIVATERAVMALPIHAQITAQNLAAKLRAISDNLASAAQYGAQTAHRLNSLANSQAAKIDDADPERSVATMQSVAMLTKLANDSSSIALNLLAANKESIRVMNDREPQPTSIDPRKLSDKSLEELLNARDRAAG